MKSSVGVILVGHQGSAAALLQAVKQIAGASFARSILADAIALDASNGCDGEFAQGLREAFHRADQGVGVLALVDLFGSSPSSLCSCLLERHRAHLVSGLSLPMLLKLALSPQSELSAAELAHACADAGRRAIIHREPSR